MDKLTIPNTFCLITDKVNFRRRLVYQLCVNGLKQKEIASKLKYSLSTIEKDFRAIRESNKNYVRQYNAST